MKIQIASDLHQEFYDNRDFLEKYPLIPSSDVLILAGDILPFNAIGMDKYNPFLDKLSSSFKNIYWIPGNHEYYGYNIKEGWDNLDRMVRPNINLCNNKTIIIEDVKIILSTLWSNITPERRFYVENGMMDFKNITYEYGAFTADVYNHLHKTCLEFITNELNDKTYKNVVVTHHVPTFMNYPERYKTSNINQGFTTELFELINEHQPEYWIYGHHHQPIPPFKIGKTKLVTNQLGYVDSNEHFNFREDFTIEI